MDPTIETVLQSDRNNFDWYVPTPTTVVVDCEETQTYRNTMRIRRPQSVVLKGLSLLTLPNRCKATTKSISASGIEPLVMIHIHMLETITQATFQELINHVHLPSPAAWNNFSETIRRLKSKANLARSYSQI